MIAKKKLSLFSTGKPLKEKKLQIIEGEVKKISSCFSFALEICFSAQFNAILLCISNIFINSN